MTATGFQSGDEDRAALVYYSRARALYVAIDEANGRELATGKTSDAVSYELFEKLKARTAQHLYLLAR